MTYFLLCHSLFCEHHRIVLGESSKISLILTSKAGVKIVSFTVTNYVSRVCFIHCGHFSLPTVCIVSGSRHSLLPLKRFRS